MDNENTNSGGTQPREPDCFEEWLFERRDRQDEVGQVARWVCGRMKPGYPERWIPEPILLARHGHAYDVPARYETYLRHVANLSEESIEMFFHVYGLYLKDARADYDRMVEERSQKIGKGSGGGGGNSGGTGSAAASGDDLKELYSSESWARFYYELHSPEVVGYELDEDGYPISRDPDGGVEER